MILNNTKLFNAYTGVDIILKNYKLPTGIGMQLAIVKSKLAPFYNAFNDRKQDLISQYVLKDEDNKYKTHPLRDGQDPNTATYDFGDNQGVMNEEYKDLLEQDIDIDRLEQIPISKFKLKNEEDSMEGELFELILPLIDVDK